MQSIHIMLYSKSWRLNIKLSWVWASVPIKPCSINPTCSFSRCCLIVDVSFLALIKTLQILHIPHVSSSCPIFKSHFDLIKYYYILEIYLLCLVFVSPLLICIWLNLVLVVFRITTFGLASWENEMALIYLFLGLLQEKKHK